MKKISLLLSAGLLSLTFAVDIHTIETEIENIQKLPPQERVEKMNELKTEILAMHDGEREKLLAIIAEKHHIKTETTAHNTKGTHNKHNKVEDENGGEHKTEMRHNMDEEHDAMMYETHHRFEMDHDRVDTDHDTVKHEDVDTDRDDADRDNDSDDDKDH